jgi:hypothetical protein
VESARSRMPPHTTPKPQRARPSALIVLLIILIIQCLGGLAGGGALIAAPSGRVMKLPASWLAGSPFHDFLIPGLILFVVLGIGPAVVIWALLARPGCAPLERVNPFLHQYWGWTLSGVIGVALVVWIVVEVAIIARFSWLQPFFGGLGVAIVALTLTPSVRAAYRR